MGKKPLLNYLSEAELNIMLGDAIRILENTGVYLPNEKAKNLMKEAGAKEESNDMIKIPPELVSQILANANPKFNLYDQTGTNFLELKIGNTFYGPGSDLQFQIDLETEKPKPTKLEDVAKNITIIDKLSEFDFLMSTGLPSDIKQEDAYKEVFKMMVLNSNKPIVATATNTEDIEKIHSIATKIAGSEQAFKDKPFYVAYLEPVSPLKIEEDVANKIIFCAEKGIPILFASGANIAIHAPGTPEGAVIQGTAESLSGLVLSYLVNSDVKFVFGANSAPFDGNKGIVSYGGPEWPKTMAYYTELARKLNFPVWGAGGSTDSNKLDAQAGLEATLSILMAELSGTTLIHDIGYLSHGDATDPRAYLLNAEIIRRVRWLAKRDAIIPGDVSQVIDDVAKGKIGTFLSSKHTLKNYDSRYHPPEWIDRNFLNDEQTSLLEKLKKEVYKILEENKPTIDAEVETKRKSQEVAKREQIAVTDKIGETKSLTELFKDLTNPNQAEKVKHYLEGRLKKKKAEKVFLELTNTLAEVIKGEDMVFQLAYGELFDQVAETVLSKISKKTEGTPFVLGTVEGDIHYVGKNLVAQLTSLSNYKIVDTGIDSKTGELILNALDNEACLIGLSALLTTTRPNMKKTINALKELGIKNQLGVIVGGAVVNQKYAEEIGADAYRRSAEEVGKALNEIKDKFVNNYKKKKVSLEEFLIIGESINSINEKVRTAMENRNEEFILDLVKKQVSEGANCIDLSVSQLGNVQNQQEAIKWAVQTIQKKFNTQLCLDSDDYRIIKAALEVYNQSKGPALINSTTLEKERMEKMVQLAKDYKTKIIFQAAEGKSVEEKINIVEQFLKYTTTKGIKHKNIYVDPGLESMAANEESAKIALQTISKLKSKHHCIHYTVGLTNIGYGLSKISKTKDLQQAFLKLGMRVGLDSAITNPSILKTELEKKVVAESIEFIAGLENKKSYATKRKEPE